MTLSCRIMDKIGVIPMPPATNRKALALRSGENYCAGALSINWVPTSTSSTIEREAPRPFASRLTAI